MQEFLSKILTEAGFTKIESNTSQQDFLFEYKDHDEEYYFLSKYTEKELSSYFPQGDQSTRTDSFLDYLEQSQQQHPNVKKNSSQIIFVEVGSLVEGFQKLKNHIYKIEEDELFLKKYVLLYNSSCLKSLRSLSITELQEKLYSSDSFEGFFTHGFNSSLDEEYFLLIQLFIKLPFIKLPEEKKDFQALDQRINDTLTENKLIDFHNKLFDNTGDKKNLAKELQGLLETLENKGNILNLNDSTIDNKLDEIIRLLGLSKDEF